MNMKAQLARGTRGMVVSGSADATRIAWETFDRGGNVVDAAIAGAVALAVTQPQACTVGGDAFILVHDAATGATEGLNASGPAPRLATRSSYGTTLPQRGPLSVTMPGVVAGWHALHARRGRLPWHELFAPSVALAREGFAATPGFARATEVYASLLAANVAANAMFRPSGAPIATGTRFKQPALAATLERIAASGPAAFYDGEIARSIAAAVEQAGGLLRANDFAGYAPEWVTPAAVGYRGHKILAMPPNSYGIYLLLQLLALDAEPRRAIDSPERIPLLVRAAQGAFAVANRAVADPRFGPEPYAPLLADRERLQRAAPASPPNRGGTAVISVADAHGNAVTIVQSIFLVFGSGVFDPVTGVLLSNRMFGFTLEPGHPNELAPAKRPAHTLCPVQVLHPDGSLRFAMGTPGGPGQTITLAQVLQARVDAGVPLDEAIAMPRWSQDLDSKVVVGRDMPETTIRALNERGIATELAAPDSPYFGSAEAIERTVDGTLTGVADFRRDAAAHGG